MNKNPLLIKSSLTGQIPFMKGRTLALYNKFLSDNKFHKVLLSREPEVITETLSAYRINSEYKTDFVFDGIEITPSVHFSEDEWIALGMLLRAYKEVEGVNLLHLYNCLFRASGSSVEGFIVSGRTYSFYSSSLLPITIEIQGQNLITLNSISSLNPFIFKVPKDYDDEESLLKVKITFSGSTYQPSTLVEGNFGSLLKPDGIINSEGQFVEQVEKEKFLKGRDDILVPQPLGIGEYSDRLVEFFAGTLATKLSNQKVFSQASQVAFSLPKFYNFDGYFGKEVQV